MAEAIGREQKRGSARRTFIDHADRDAFIAKFVHDYNRTRLKCLGYLAPMQALANHTGPNTKAGTHNHRVVLLKRAVAPASRNSEHSGLWVPAFARTTLSVWHGLHPQSSSLRKQGPIATGLCC
ncbi:hypothetical protein [Bradyrhizobium sp. USDA 4350]